VNHVTIIDVIKLDNVHYYKSFYVQSYLRCNSLRCCVVGRGADTLIEQAQSWESKGEYLRAIDCYVRLTSDVTSDTNVLQRCWVKVSHFHISSCSLPIMYSFYCISVLERSKYLLKFCDIL